MADAVDPPFDRPDQGFNSLVGWTWVGCYGGYYLQADQLAAFEHGFFTRQWQGRPPEELAAYLSAGVSVHRTRQVHGAQVLPASQVQGDPWPEADGLVSDGEGQSLWVCGADCTPVLIADPVSGRVASCHAGWRGVAGRILPAAIAALEARGCRRADLLVALGPAVSGAAYQVEAPVAEAVAQAVAPELALAADGAVSALEASGALAVDPQQSGRYRLDLRAATALQLEAEGIAAERISLCPLCTVGEPLLFHSWRRDQVKAVQWSGIVSQAI